MFYLLKLEWLKFKNYRIFQVMIGFFVVLLPGILLIGKSINELPPEFGTTEMFYIFPSVWKFLTYIGNWLAFFFLGFLGVIAVTMEYGNKTLRQNIINGLSREEVFGSKALFILGVSLAATLYLILCGLIIGFWNTQTVYVSKIMEGGPYIFRFFLLCVGYMSFGSLVGVLLRRTGLALFLYLTYIMFIEPVFRWAIHFRYFPGEGMHYYPLNIIEDLLPVPFAKIAEEFMEENNFDMFLDPGTVLVMAIFYILVFFGLIFWRLRRADL